MATRGINSATKFISSQMQPHDINHSHARILTISLNLDINQYGSNVTRKKKRVERRKRLKSTYPTSSGIQKLKPIYSIQILMHVKKIKKTVVRLNRIFNKAIVIDRILFTILLNINRVGAEGLS